MFLSLEKQLRFHKLPAADCASFDTCLWLDLECSAAELWGLSHRLTAVAALTSAASCWDAADEIQLVHSAKVLQVVHASFACKADHLPVLITSFSPSCVMRVIACFVWLKKCRDAWSS